MKKIYFSLLMISAMFMAASCGSKSNSSGATASDETETATPTYEPADPPFTFSKVDEDEVYGKRLENIPLNGVFEIQKVALAKVRGKIEYSGQLSGEGDCISITVYLKMINDYLQEPTYMDGSIQLLNKDDAVLYKFFFFQVSGVADLRKIEKGSVGILTATTNKPDIDVDDILANTKYIRIAGFEAGKEVAE